MSNRLLLINDTGASPNQGCRATMQAVNEALARYFPDYEVDRIPLGTVARPVEDEAWRRLLPDGPGQIERALKWFLASEDADLRDVIEAIEAADLVVVNGEGSIAENRLSRRLGPQSLMVFMLIELAAHFRKAVHLVNCSLHVTRAESMGFAKSALNKCVSVSVREPYSYFYGRKVCQHVKLFPDLVCTLTPPEPPDIEGAYAMVGGSAAVNVYPRGGKLPGRIRDGYRRVCDFLARRGVSVQLMGWDRDEFLQEFVGDTATYVDCDYETYFSYCAGALFNFTGRHHGIVMSFAAGCPFTALSANMFKTEGDTALYGGAFPVADFEQFDAAQIETNLAKLLEDHDTFKQKALQRREALRPFFAGSIENIIEPREDLVAAGLVDISDNAEDYAYHSWHNRSLFDRVGRKLAGVFSR